MKLHIRRDVNEWIIVDTHCCTELEIARDEGALHNSQFFDDDQEGIHLNKLVRGTSGPSQHLMMKYRPFCGHKFSITDIEGRK